MVEEVVVDMDQEVAEIPVATTTEEEVVVETVAVEDQGKLDKLSSTHR